MIKFTIITAIYNSESVLQRTLDSVLSQHHHEIEHLILDGASSDHSLELAKAYKEKSDQMDNDHEIRILSEPDKGLYYAMNKGIELATGDYLLFLNAGDTFPAADTLDLAAGNIADGEQLPGVLYGETDVVNMEGHFVRHRRLTAPKRLTWKSFRQGMVVCHQSFYALTRLAKEHPYNTHYRFSADVDWCIRIMKASAQQQLPLRNTHLTLTNYLEGGMSTQNHRASLKERFEVMASHYGYFQTALMHLWFVLRSVIKK